MRPEPFLPNLSILVGYLLPSLKATRLQHLQDIMCSKKKVLRQKDVPARKIPQWPQLAVKLIYTQVAKMVPDILDYLPDLQGKDEDRYPERDFFYRVLNALHPELVDQLISEAAGARMPKAQNLQEEQWRVSITPEWMDRLLMYDFTSSKSFRFLFFLTVSSVAKKGNGLSSLLIQQIGRGQQKRRRGNDGQPIVEAPPVRKVNAEDQMLAAFLQASFQQQQLQPGGQAPTGKLAEPPGGFGDLQYTVKQRQYPGTKKRPYPFSLGQGQMPSGHKSDTDLKQQFGTPGGFEDNLDDFAMDGGKIVEEDDEESQFLDQEDNG